MGRLRLRFISLFLTVAVLGLAPAEASDRDVTVDDVIRLAQSGISDETIIAFLDTQPIGFTLDADVLLQLRSAGVSEAVIQSLLERARPTPGPPLTYAAPAAPLYGYRVPYPPAYYAYPRDYYAAPVRVFFSFGLPHSRHGRAFVHHHHHRGVAAGHFPVAAGHFPVSVGHFPVAAGHFPVSVGHFPVSVGHFPVVAGHRTLTVRHAGHAGRHVHGGHSGHRGHR
ncbi:MAG: hypothetical protein ACRD2X_01230 [Vicinamibacteraceae bacterium]